jgi:hypothetical protein
VVLLVSAKGRRIVARVQRVVSWCAAALLLVTAVACGSDDTSVSSRAFGAVTGGAVIQATKAEETATFAIEDHGSVADPGTDHGTSGEEEETLEYEAAFDFTRNRSLIRWQFPADIVGEPVDVEARTIDGTSYVKDGSWLCPGCGMDGDEPLPNDKWIINDGADGDVAFDFSSSAFHGHLGWLSLLDDPVEPGSTSKLRDGTTVASYRAAISVEEVNAAVKATDPENEYAPEYQGDTIIIIFKADAERRLRELVVKYHVDDRARTLTATLGTFGDRLAIEIPPEKEIYQG